MFSAVAVFADPTWADVVRRLAVESTAVSIRKDLEYYPADYELRRLLNGYDPDLLLVELSRRATPLIEAVRSLSPRVGIIALGPRAIELGTEIKPQTVIAPFTLEAFEQAVRAAVHDAGSKPDPNLIAFLPSKAGSGATTVALNVAGAVGNQLGLKTLTIEADLHSGIISTLLNAKPKFHVRSALQSAATLDQHLWDKHVTAAQGVDFLLTEKSKKEPVPTWANYHQLLTFTLARYGLVIVDLPEIVNDATHEAVLRAKTTYIVCTPELPSLTLARQRCEELSLRGIPRGRIQIVLNRFQSDSMKPPEVEKLVGYPIAAILENDYRAVNRATLAGDFIDPKTKLGRSLVSFATQLAGVEVRSPGRGLLATLGLR
jgi:pilus assembly protein CpaE